MSTFACLIMHKWSRWAPFKHGGRLINHRWCLRCGDIEIKDIPA